MSKTRGIIITRKITIMKRAGSLLSNIEFTIVVVLTLPGGRLELFCCKLFVISVNALVAFSNLIVASLVASVAFSNSFEVSLLVAFVEGGWADVDW